MITVGSSDPHIYRKHHLVPFGETIPLKSVVGWFIHRVLSIPLADQAAGPANTPPLQVAGQRAAVNICYEDVFGEELRHAARTATLLINVTNDAWYGRSIAAWQHDQIAAMRALETGRPLLRATNTGVTAAIGPDGRETARLPWYHARHTRSEQVHRPQRRNALCAVGDLGPVPLWVALLLVAFGADRARRRFA